MADAETYRERYSFTVKEFGDGTPWIMLETLDKDLPILTGPDGKQNAFLGFDLADGTTYEEARKIAEYFDDHVKTVTCTVYMPSRNMGSA